MTEENSAHRADDTPEADESPLDRAQSTIDEAKEVAEEDRRLKEAQAGFENLPLEDPPQHTTGHTPP
ncbi:hypothetical protein [Saccharomonospora halophila]|uniref:hypothetical protein n=1 Tax=Saccharomonospora halophila TaxID=129922 RepID=UPI0003765E2A|nr:hypothetical protein [Saccharomonospora halophila]